MLGGVAATPEVQPEGDVHLYLPTWTLGARKRPMCVSWAEPARTEEYAMPRVIPDLMVAAVTMGVGGSEQVQIRQIPVPEVGVNDLLVRVLAAGVNNTDINTRVGWYDKEPGDASGYNGATSFPLVQGADCCGVVVAAGRNVQDPPLDRRVLVRSCMTGTIGPGGDATWLGSDRDGAFAQYLVVPATEVFPITSTWSDAELATIPCSYGTAENMVQRAGIREGDRVLVTGASGGVGSAAVQLAHRRGAEVIAVASRRKHEAVNVLGAAKSIDRGADLGAELDGMPIDVAIDNVAGSGFSGVLATVRPGGTYVTSGAIAGPVVELDLRTLYLRDIRLLGTTTWDPGVFRNLVSYVERDEIRPVLAATFPLEDITRAQKCFQSADRVGNVVLIPPEAPDRPLSL